MSEEFEITMQARAEIDLFTLILKQVDKFSETEEVTWNDIFILHGALSGALNRYQSLPRDKA